MAIAEGEQDVETLERLGFVATCNVGGAGKFKGELAKWFRGDQHISLFEDNDAAVRNHVQQVAFALYRTVASIKIIRLSGLPAKHSVSACSSAAFEAVRALRAIVAQSISP